MLYIQHLLSSRDNKTIVLFCTIAACLLSGGVQAAAKGPLAHALVSTPDRTTFRTVSVKEAICYLDWEIKQKDCFGNSYPRFHLVSWHRRQCFEDMANAFPEEMAEAIYSFLSESLRGTPLKAPRVERILATFTAFLTALQPGLRREYIVPFIDLINQIKILAWCKQLTTPHNDTSYSLRWLVLRALYFLVEHGVACEDDKAILREFLGSFDACRFPDIKDIKEKAGL